MLYLYTAHQREQRDFTSRQALSIAQIIALHSIDAETVALTWMMLEHGVSLTIAGPTEPRPGAGKSTVMNALLQFLPANSALAYMSGKYETFDFTRLPDVKPTTTYAVCNEVSDHQSTYMWGAAARRYLTLPAQGYHIVTTVHADTIDDVLHLYQHDLHLRSEDLRRLGLIVNVGLIGQGKSPLRRWISTHILPTQPDPLHPEALTPLPLSRWNAATDTFAQASQSVLDELADWTGLAPQNFTAALQRRTNCLQELARGEGADVQVVQVAIDEIRRHEK